MMSSQDLQKRFGLGNISLYWVMLVPFVVQIVGAVSLVGYLSYRSGESAIDKLANRIMQEVGDRIDQNLVNYLRKPTEINQNNAASIKLGILDWQNLATVEKYFWQQSQIFTDISALAIATEQKEILIIEKLDDGSHAIRLRDQTTNYNWDNYLADSDGNRKQLLRRSSTYDPYNDPPNNPWYGQTKKARRSLWRLTVSLANPKKPSLIAANFLPFFDRNNDFQGVLGTSVSLTQLGDFLKKLKVSTSGQAFIIERNGQMIGMSTGEIPFRQGLLAPLTTGGLNKNVDPNNRRLHVLNSQNDLTKMTAQYLIEHFGSLENIKERQQLQFEQAGIHYFVQVLPLQNDLNNQDLDWLAVLVIPETDFIAEIQANKNLTIWLCGLTLVVSMGIGIVITRWITSPILRLGKASEALVKGDWRPISEDIAIAEIKTLAISFNWMAEQFYQSFTQIKNTLRDSEAKFSNIFQVSPDPAWIATLAEGRCLYVNQSLGQFMETDPSNIIGHTCREIDLWDDLEDFHYYHQTLVKEGIIQNFEVVVRTATRATKTVLISAIRVYLDGQDCVIGVIKDISDRKQLEMTLRDSEKRLRLILESTPAFIAGIYIHNLDIWEYQYYSPNAEAIYGYTSEQIAQNPWLIPSLILPEDMRRVIKPILPEIMTSGFNTTIEYRIRRVDGTIRWLSNTLSSIWDESMQCIYMTGITLDITDRKQAEADLDNSKTFVQRIMDITPNLMYIYDLKKQRNVYVNRPIAELLGYSDIEIQEIGANLLQTICHPDDFEKVCEAIQQCQALNDHEYVELEYRVRDADGNWRWLYNREGVFSRASDGSVKETLGTSQDISNLKEVEIELRESQAKLNAAYTEQSILFNAMTDVVLVRDAEGRCIKIAATKNLNLKGTYEEVLNKPINEELPQECANIILQAIHTSLATRQMVSCEYSLEINGRDLWFVASISPLTEDTVIQIARDITERKHAEIILANAKEAAEAATKAKSEFLANMSHEIRTPMNGVLVMAQLLATTELTEDQQEFVQTILDSGDVLLAIINDILDFSKIESGMLEIEQREFLLEEVISSVFNLLNGQAKDKKIELQYSLHPDMPTHIVGDSARLRQVLINLIGNAIKFTPCGTISVSATASPLANDKQYKLQFAVTDNGIGIQSDRIVNLFQAFTQADTSISRRYGGTGLGLAISRKLIELMGGTIWVESFGQIGGNSPVGWQSELVTQGATFYFVIHVAVHEM
ncbi:PAS domain S-box protein [Pseudanabaena sp. Chao 1811]|uniref:PAS domain S-box protein n=1 Tax=Pseudanabaena sp. Chao 1811 TaxID=2963092 RepID=UPI0022F3C1C8|nr:PAS domain S-box protein [Pseudanabaena sp. Chao 1811]